MTTTNQAIAHAAACQAATTTSLRTIAEKWAQFEARFVPMTATDDERRSTRRAFYAGCIGCLDINLEVSRSVLSHEAKVAVLQGIHEEAFSFIEEFRAGRA